MRVCVAFAWAEPARAVVRDGAGKLTFPLVPDRPGIYRLAFDGADSSVAYVGEANNLQRRMGNYRHPGPTQRTSQRVHRLIDECIAQGGQVHLTIMRDAALEIDARLVPLDLSKKACRLLVENAILVALHDTGMPVHNL